MKEKILIAEDEERLRSIIREYLEGEEYEVYEAVDGKEALEIFTREEINLAIIDIMMPQIDGWEVCRGIREISETPIIIITARSEEEEKLRGFTIGADDYVTKPFSTRVLFARVKSLLKRSRYGSVKDEETIIDGHLVVDIKGYSAKLSGIDLGLTTREYEILVYLLKNKGIVKSRNQILDDIWGYDYYGNSRVIDAHIKKIRKKLGENGVKIKTILGVGYKYGEI